jgi:hypothetical protein
MRRGNRHVRGARSSHQPVPQPAQDPDRRDQDTGRLDHIAFAATDVAAVRYRLKAGNVSFREQIVPRTGDTQIFLYNPDGVGVELNFPKA